MLQNSKLVKFQKINRKITNGYLINSCTEVSFPYRIAFQEEISMTFLWYFYFLIKVVIFTKYTNSRTLDGITVSLSFAALRMTEWTLNFGYLIISIRSP